MDTEKLLILRLTAKSRDSIEDVVAREFPLTVSCFRRVTQK